MLEHSRSRISKAVHLLNPVTFLRTLNRVDQLADAVKELTKSVDALRVRTEQLFEVERLDSEQREDIQALSEELDADLIGRHVRAAIAAAPLHMDPFPHIVVEKWLPRDVYATIVRAIPPAVFFADREVSRQRMIVPFPVAPAYSQHVWRFVASDIVGGVVGPALTEKFGAVMSDYVRSFCPAMPPDTDLALHTSDGRIMLRRPGYVIAPHRDPKWGFVTGLMYLARSGDSETYGTQLYRVKDDEEAPTGTPLYFDPTRCELVRSVPFRANTLLVFLNSVGAHGASIPAEALPAALERYVYQFRLGPDAQTISKLLACMTPDRRALWGGGKAERADVSY
jgi:hypothetical protein